MNAKIIEVNKNKYAFWGNSMIFIKLKENSSNSRNLLDNKIIKQIDEIDLKSCSIIEKAKEESKGNLKGIQINPMNACNMNCKYCFAGDGTHGSNYIINEKVIKDSISFLFDNLTSRTATISIIGGEPFLNLDAVEKILKLAHNASKKYAKDVRFLITTNGTILNDKIKKLLNTYNISLMVSLDSSIEYVHNYLRPFKYGEGSYNKIRRNLPIFVNEYDSAVHITITPYNLNIYKTAKELIDYGVKKIHFSLVKSNLPQFSFSEENFEELKLYCTELGDFLITLINQGKNIQCYPLLTNFERIKNRQPLLTKCRPGREILAISPKGDLFPCDMLMWKDYKLGNFNSYVANDNFVEYKKCQKCWARYICGGLCAADLVLLNDYNKSVHCLFNEQIAKLQLYIFDSLRRGFSNGN